VSFLLLYWAWRNISVVILLVLTVQKFWGGVGFGFVCLMQLGVQNGRLQHQQQQLLPSVGFKIFSWKRLDVG
jgi:hypothetical protein